MTATSLFLVFALIFGNMAMIPDSMNGILSGEVDIKVRMQINSPTDEEVLEVTGINYLSGLEFDTILQFNASEDLKKLDLYSSMSFALSEEDEVNELEFWSRTDFSDRNIPKSFTVIKSPQDLQHSVMDIQKPQADPMNNGFIFQPFLNPEKIKTINNNIKKAVETHETKVTTTEDGYGITLDENTVKMLLYSSILETVKSMRYMFGGNTQQFEQEINYFFKSLDDVQIFAEDALVIDIETDSNQMPKSLSGSLNINTNLKEFVAIFGGYLGDDMLDEQALVVSINITADFDKLNEDIAIEFPELNNENASYMYTDQLDIDINKVNVLGNYHELTEFSNQPFIKDGITYLPLRETLHILGFPDDNILWNDGEIVLNLMGNEFTINIDSPTISQEAYFLDMTSNVLLVETNTFVPVEMFSMLNLGNISNVFYGENDDIIGSVVSLYGGRIPAQKESVMRILVPSDLDPSWLESIEKAADYTGEQYEVITSDVSQHTERTNLVIAAGEPMMIFSNMDGEYLEPLNQQGVFHDIVQINDEYKILIPSVIQNLDSSIEFVKMFFTFIENLYLVAE